MTNQLAETLDALTTEFKAWCEKNKKPQWSADEILSELCDNDPAKRSRKRREQIEYVHNFILRWEAAEDAEPQQLVEEMMTKRGYEVWSTGGGCTGFGKVMPDGGHVLVCTDDQGVKGHPEKEIWMTGRYAEDGSWINYEKYYTLEQAITVGEATRVPNPGDEEMIRAEAQ